MEPREQRGLIIAGTKKLTQQDDGRWIVPSQNAAKKTYIVDADKQTCTCPDHENGHKCKHLYAVEFVIKRELNEDGTITETKTLTFTEKKTYPQNWPAYNLAQTTEKHRFQVLLHDLCRGLTEFPRKNGRGRKPVPAANAVFGAAFKVFTMISTRRFSCDLQDAHAKGHVSRPIHYNSICAYLENPELTPRLHSLIRQSSLPLNAVEKVFAVDSTGFSSSRFVRWYDEKYGVTRPGHDWVKAHVMCGVNTHAVTAVVIENRDAADAPQFKHLLDDTARTSRLWRCPATRRISRKKTSRQSSGPEASRTSCSRRTALVASVGSSRSPSTFTAFTMTNSWSITTSAATSNPPFLPSRGSSGITFGAGRTPPCSTKFCARISAITSVA